MEKTQKNLFEYAKKELSQDAIIAWLLHGEYGEKFVRSMCPSISDGFSVKMISTQEKHIDILVELESGSGEKIAVIIEDKVDTYLHNFQMLSYIAKIANQSKKVKRGSVETKPVYETVYFVLFKTGDIPYYEYKDFNEWKKRLNEGCREFSADELNQTIKGVLLSTSYIKDGIVLQNGVEIKVEDIYTLNSFRKFLNDIPSDGLILDYYKTYLNSAERDQSVDTEGTEDKKIENLAEEYNKRIDNKIRLVTVKPEGGGKRQYELNMISEDMIIDIKGGNRFLILPVLARLDDGNYRYIIQCQLCTDMKNKIHGYVPWEKLSKEQKLLFVSYKSKIADWWGKDREGWTTNSKFSITACDPEDLDKNDNGLQLCKFDGEMNQANLERFLDTALEISRCVSDNI